MARNYVGITPRGPTTFYNVHRDVTGEPLIFMDEDEVKTLVLDFTDYEDQGETISSVATEAKSVTCTAASTSTKVTLSLSAATTAYDGSVTVVVTFSTGAKWRGVIRVRRTARYTDDSRIGDYA